MFISFNGIEPHLLKEMHDFFLGKPSLWVACSSSEEYCH